MEVKSPFLLRSCPFCGGKANIETRQTDKLPEEWHVGCFNECEVSPSVWRGSEVEAISAWNKRRN